MLGLKLTKAYAYLGDVSEHKQVIPFRRFDGGVGRASQAKQFKATQGAFDLLSTRGVHGSQGGGKVAGPRSLSSSSSVSSRTRSRTPTRKTLSSRTSTSRTSLFSRPLYVHLFLCTNLYSPLTIAMLYDRKLAAAHTVHTVALTPTRATPATSKSSSVFLMKKLNAQRTMLSQLVVPLLASTAGKLHASALRLHGREELGRR